MWKCQCDCGNMIPVRSDSLQNGHTTSCGCKTKNDLTGQIFGLLTAIAPTEKRSAGCIVWKCKCKCGAIVYISGHSLKDGYTTSCGCKRIRDLTGMKFGLLTVIKMSGRRDSGGTIWKCKCACGTIVRVRSDSLQSGRTLSCGCLKSRMERETSIYLKEKGVIFEAQYYLPGTRLRFDFMILNEDGNPKIAIENQGKHHYFPIQYDGVSKHRAKQKFASQLARDNYKRKWCAEQGIPLIEILYNDFDLDKYLADITD